MPHLFPLFTSGSRNGICLISTGSIVPLISSANESIVNKGDLDNDYQDVPSLFPDERGLDSTDHVVALIITDEGILRRLSILSTELSWALQKRQDVKLGEIKKSNKDQEILRMWVEMQATKTKVSFEDKTCIWREEEEKRKRRGSLETHKNGWSSSG